MQANILDYTRVASRKMESWTDRTLWILKVQRVRVARMPRVEVKWVLSVQKGEPEVGGVRGWDAAMGTPTVG